MRIVEENGTGPSAERDRWSPNSPFPMVLGFGAWRQGFVVLCLGLAT